MMPRSPTPALLATLLAFSCLGGCLRGGFGSGDAAADAAAADAADAALDVHPPADAGPETSLQPNTERSGSRLKAIYYEAEGLSHFAGWHDTLLGFDCGFRNFEGSGMRCIPLRPHTSGGTAIMGGTIFADAACTQSAVQARRISTCPEKTAIREDAQQALCIGNDEPALFRFMLVAMALVSSSTPVPGYTDDGSGSCLPLGEDVYPMDVLDLATLVGGTLQAAEAGPLTRRILRTEDGAEETFDYLDKGSGLPCAPARSVDHALRCLPGNAAGYTNIFADASCTEPLYSITGLCSDTPPRLRYIASCGEGSSVHLPGADAPSQAYEYASGGCVASAYSPTNTITRGEEIAPQTFVALSEEVVGGGRLRRNHAVLDALRTDIDPFWDTELHLRCSPLVDREGQRRCLPKIAYRRYLDAQCTEAAVLLSCPDESHVSLVDLSLQSCEVSRYRVYELGAELTSGGAIYDKDASGACNESINRGNRIYPLGAELAPSLFVAFTRVLR